MKIKVDQRYKCKIQNYKTYRRKSLIRQIIFRYKIKTD